jgi:hypothetical protein
MGTAKQMLTLWSRVSVENLIVTKLVKTSRYVFTRARSLDSILSQFGQSLNFTSCFLKRANEQKEEEIRPFYGRRVQYNHPKQDRGVHPVHKDDDRNCDDD